MCVYHLTDLEEPFSDVSAVLISWMLHFVFSVNN